LSINTGLDVEANEIVKIMLRLKVKG